MTLVACRPRVHVGTEIQAAQQKKPARPGLDRRRHMFIVVGAAGGLSLLGRASKASYCNSRADHLHSGLYQAIRASHVIDDSPAK